MCAERKITNKIPNAVVSCCSDEGKGGPRFAGLRPDGAVKAVPYLPQLRRQGERTEEPSQSPPANQALHLAMFTRMRIVFHFLVVTSNRYVTAAARLRRCAGLPIERAAELDLSVRLDSAVFGLLMASISRGPVCESA